MGLFGSVSFESLYITDVRMFVAIDELKVKHIMFLCFLLRR